MLKFPVRSWRNSHRSLLAVLLGFVAMVCGVGLRSAWAQLPYPPAPAGQEFVSDFAHLLKPADAAKIGPLQQVAFEKHGVPIIVVTVASMNSYGFNGEIETFAREWFDRWRIGTTDKEGGANNGVLLIVSLVDRKARIELGGDWGRDWDDHCQDIMAGSIIPRFKKGDYSGGLLAGVEELAKMAEQGPKAAPQPPGVLKKIATKSKAGEPLWEGSKIPVGIGIAMVGLGIALLIGSFFVPGEGRMLMQVVGIVLIILPIAMYVGLVLILALLQGGRAGLRQGWRVRSVGGGGSYSGGGFSGGSSGGGGATGSW